MHKNKFVTIEVAKNGGGTKEGNQLRKSMKKGLKKARKAIRKGF